MSARSPLGKSRSSVRIGRSGGFDLVNSDKRIVSSSNQSDSTKSIHQSRFTNHFAQLCDIVAKLRSPEGCPWDREQTNASLVPGLLEEAYEVAGAVYAHYLTSLPMALPALMRAEKAQKKAARVNFDWRELRDVIAKVEEELKETKSALASAEARMIADEIGDLLFAVVNLARKCQLEAESLLQSATDKFVARFNEMEDRLRARDGKLGKAGLEELDAIWEEIKKDARS